MPRFHAPLKITPRFAHSGVSEARSGLWRLDLPEILKNFDLNPESARDQPDLKTHTKTRLNPYNSKRKFTNLQLVYRFKTLMVRSESVLAQFSEM